MGSEIIKNTGAKGRQDVALFDPDDIVLITDPSHVQYDERVHLPVDEARVQSIIEEGVVEPIVVQFDGKPRAGGRVICVDGRGRVRDCREANKRLRKAGKEPRRIPAVIYRGHDSEGLGILLNELRTQDTPLVRAKKAQRYIAHGHSEEEATRKFGVSRGTLRGMLSLLDCAPEVQAAVEKGTVSATLAAKEIAVLPREKQVEALGLLAASGARGEAARETVSRVRNGTSNGAKAPAVPMKRRAFVESWKKKLARCEDRDHQEARIGRAVLSHLLGNDRALADFPILAGVLGEAEDG